MSYNPIVKGVSDESSIRLVEPFLIVDAQNVEYIHQYNYEDRNNLHRIAQAESREKEQKTYLSQHDGEKIVRNEDQAAIRAHQNAKLKSRQTVNNLVHGHQYDDAYDSVTATIPSAPGYIIESKNLTNEGEVAGVTLGKPYEIADYESVYDRDQDNTRVDALGRYSINEYKSIYDD